MFVLFHLFWLVVPRNRLATGISFLARRGRWSSSMSSPKERERKRERDRKSEEREREPERERERERLEATRLAHIKTWF